MDLSVAAQLRALRDYAAKNGYIVAREYVDEAESGRVADRPQFRRMLDDAGRPEAPFLEILVWKFSRFTRKREHAVAFKAMLRRRGVRVVSITEHADDSPTGRLMEAIIESVDEFYSENLAQEVTRGMREAASRGFWIAPMAPYGYRKVHVADGAKKRPKLEVDPEKASTVERVFKLAESGSSVLDIVKALNAEGIASPAGKEWSKTGIHKMLTNIAYTGTLVWGSSAKAKAEPVTVEDAFPALVSKSQFRRVADLMRSRAPSKIHPKRVASTYLLSGLVKCRSCRRALTGQSAKSGRFAYYVCQSKLKRGRAACKAPRLNARRFESLVVDKMRSNVLTERNIRDLAKLVDEEMDGAAREHREKLESIRAGLDDARRRLGRLYAAIEDSDLEVSDLAPRIRELREREQKLLDAEREADAALSDRRTVMGDVERIAAFAEDLGEFLKNSELTERRAFISSFVEEIVVGGGEATIRYTLPMPQDAPTAGMDAENVSIPRPVLSTVKSGGAEGIRTPDLINAIDALSQLSYSPTVMGRTMQLVLFGAQFPPDLRDPISSHRRLRLNSNLHTPPTSCPRGLPRTATRGQRGLHPITIHHSNHKNHSSKETPTLPFLRQQKGDAERSERRGFTHPSFLTILTILQIRVPTITLAIQPHMLYNNK